MTTPDQNHESPDGYAQMAAMLAGNKRAPMADRLGFELVEIERGRAVFEGSPERTVYNPIGAVHGGYAATLLDSACGCAVHAALDAGLAYTTLELKVTYLRALTDSSGPVRAVGTVTKMGRRAAFAEATLTDRDGKLCATASSTLLVFPLEPPTS